MAKKSNKNVYIVALLLLLGGLGYLLFSGLSQNSVYFLNVSEALAMPADELSNIRLFGTVADSGIEGGPGQMGVSFHLLDKNGGERFIPVRYTGVVPDTFKPGVEVIVEGGLEPASGVFGARTLMTKCPSKYQKQRDEERAAQG
ncbi:cytochrome c-type biogenesis protein CcmE [Desulfobaculum xiamenense]|uniref:Cytochrome c-type biogenesis protein CcmE n=1 Tax=Desulfobaculum xiamenense TaxID=995050 RepID=A0A846QLR9_9BACT|nr:cytochrome c maturation protein CcmE [Desulfobaculum xiamenense]NJB67402.1 cytochrome c-type biogenesis protein CcmE [Desulfobaculum xiamenense]